MPNEQEERKLSAVRDEILRQIDKNTTGLRARRETVREARRLMTESFGAGAIRDFDDVASLAMYAAEVAQTESAYGETHKELARLTRILDTPYFARIDFIEDEYEDTEEIYIGRHSLFDENTRQFHVYDWRAPISSLYYDYGVGPASFAVPASAADKRGPLQPAANSISGKITLKRQYQIERGELVYFFDSDLAVVDDILRLELSKASDAKIKTIIHSIQSEQNKAIRSEADTVLVYGPAGSGKTSVGLHRLAYLLYRHRETLSSGRVRIFSPSPVFASYIEGIIPELGEEDVLNVDFPGLLTFHNVPPFHDGYELIDYINGCPPDDPRRMWLTQKYSPAFLDHLEQSVRAHAPSLSEDIYFYRDKICDKARLAALYADRAAASTLAGKAARVLEYVRQSASEYFKANLSKIADLFNAIHDENLPADRLRAYYDEEMNVVLADLRNRLLPRSKVLYEKVLKAWIKQGACADVLHKLPIRYIHESLRRDVLYFEDALALFYIDILTGRVPPDKTVRHILLDEAQDCSPLQHRILQRQYPSSHFTVLADTNQALYPDINLHDISALTDLYEGAQTIPLTKSYRSTYEINRFALKVLAGPNDIDESSLYMRRGEEPEVITVPDPAAAVWDIVNSLPEGFNTVGILLSDARKAKVFYNRLKANAPEKRTCPPMVDKLRDIHSLHLIATAESRFAPGIMVMAVPFAKGLEFDAVICPEYGEIGGKMLYLICTRALHRLYLLKPTPQSL